MDGMKNMEAARACLKKYWGYDDFRLKQAQIVESALNGVDTLALLPTGGGKSVCFQLPALMRPGIALVITPLISLMKDQVQNLEARGIKALAVYSGMSRREVDLALNNACYGDFKFLYLSPERLSTRLFQQYVRAMNVSYIVVDEAHCISQWGYDFRSDYLSIGELRNWVDAPVLALTATATPEVCQDIVRLLARPQDMGAGQKEENSGFAIIKSGFERPNLSYIVRNCEDKFGKLLQICQSQQGTGIVYLRSRRRCEELAKFLTDNGHSASFYHAGLSAPLRAQRQEEWKSDKIRIMVCTNAFGMGIDKPDVRFVVHFDIPDSPEAYFQEAGRAGRDGKRSYAVLLWNGHDKTRLSQINRVSYPSPEYIEDVYQKLHKFYDIAYENGEGRQLKFVLEEFCKQFSLERAMARNALAYLEKSGHISYTPDATITTKVGIICSRESLYGRKDFQDEKMPLLLDALMRRYTAIFSYVEPVEEDYLAAQIGVSQSQLRQLLYQLSLMHLIRYIPADEATVIYLHHARYYPKDLYLNLPLYEQLKKTSAQRSETMLEYVEQQDSCRSRFLLRYFGQEESEDCGSCDWCKELAKTKKKSDGEADLKHFIMEEMKGCYKLEDVKRRFFSIDTSQEQRGISLLRRWIDEGVVPPAQEE
ncbi:MAG: RecQ family ATP-dependent DNA helicase [Bacteroidales bacterium]|nr:RecQ family ATP-dependent DNA helicase [Bacteroidales bacterium]